MKITRYLQYKEYIRKNAKKKKNEKMNGIKGYLVEKHISRYYAANN